ncbi:MAG: type II toxin-antitoxin system VapC family toxin [Nanoarchaeota archaeon]
MLILDTNVLIDAIDGSARSKRALDAIGEELAATTSITIHELFCADIPEKERFILNGLLERMKVFDYDLAAAQASSQIQRELKRQDRMINVFDVLIAGVCKANDLKVLTFDKDFSKVRGLKCQILA